MTLHISFLKTPAKNTDTAVVLIDSDRKLGSKAQEINKIASGTIENALTQNKAFKGKNGETLVITLPEAAKYKQIILLGIGKTSELTPLKAQEVGGKLFKTLQSTKALHTALLMSPEGRKTTIETGIRIANIAAGLDLRSYNFEKYKTKNKKDSAEKPSKFDIITEDATLIKNSFEQLDTITKGVFLARDLVNEPPNHLYPESFAALVKKELSPLGVSVEILDEKKMEKMGMGAILAVGMGSARPPRMVIMRWNGGKKGKKTDKPIALIGKGVTFDTGGISIKPGPGMEEMKMDMGGAAAVVGTMKTLALRGSKACVIGAIGLAENMPSDRAYRPSDILKSHSGKTIEVLNTDAEGRLVLADVLSYIQETYTPHTVIDLATLTGAMMVALGQEYCGTFANDDALWAKLEAASAKTGEKLWRMPLDDVWKKDMEGTFGDVQNLAKMGRLAGSCTAAGFLEHFIKKGVKWAHMDIAGTAWIKADKPTVPKYGTGFGVRVLNQYIADSYE